MARRRFALERGGPKRLELSWRRGMRDFQVALDGAIWKIERSALATGAAVALPDGSRLLVQRVRRRFWSIDLRGELRLERGGLPVPGSDRDPRVIGRRAASLVGLIGVLTVADAIMGFWTFLAAGVSIDDAWTSTLPFTAVEGPILVVLSVLAGFGRRLPVALAAGILALEFLALETLATFLGPPPNPAAVFIRALIVVHLVRAWHRMRPGPSIPSIAAVFE